MPEPEAQSRLRRSRRRGSPDRRHPDARRDAGEPRPEAVVGSDRDDGPALGRGWRRPGLAPASACGAERRGSDAESLAAGRRPSARRPPAARADPPARRRTLPTPGFAAGPGGGRSRMPDPTLDAAPSMRGRRGRPPRQGAHQDGLRPPPLPRRVPRPPPSDGRAHPRRGRGVRPPRRPPRRRRPRGASPRDRRRHPGRAACSSPRTPRGPAVPHSVGARRGRSRRWSLAQRYVRRRARRPAWRCGSCG